MKNVMQLGMVITSVMLFSPVSHAKEYYKWVDSKGTTHYTTTPPPKSAKNRGKIDTYGYRQPTQPAQQTTPAPAQPAETPNQSIPVPNASSMDAQQREANAALDRGAQQRSDLH